MANATHNAPERRRRAAFWNLLFGYANIGGALARNVLLVPVYLTFMTLEEYGAWLAIGMGLAQLVMMDLGVSAVLTQRVSALRGAGSRNVGDAVGSGLVAGGLVSCGLLVVALTLLPVLDRFAAFSPDLRASMATCYVLAITAGALGLIANLLQSLLKSLEYSFVAGASMLIAELVSIVVTISALMLGSGVFALALGMLARAVILLIASAAWSIARVRSEAFGVRVTRPEVLRYGIGSVYLFVITLAMRLHTRVDTMFVAFFMGPAAAGIYGITVRAMEFIRLLLGQFGFAFAPALASVHGSATGPTLASVIQRMLPIIAVIAAAGTAGYVLFNAIFVDVWVGSEQFAGWHVTALVGLAGYLTTVAHVAYDARLAQGAYRQIAWRYVIVSLIHVSIVGLAASRGLSGIAAAGVVSGLAAVMLLWYQLYENSIRSALKCLASDAVLLAPVLGWVLLLDEFDGHWHWAELGGLAIAYVVLLLIALTVKRSTTRTLIAEFATLRRLLPGMHR